MIRYSISLAELNTRIQAENASWLTRAHERTERFRGLGKYEEESSIWSDIKPVYLELQQQKCGYCERKLEAQDRGLGEHDIEHFRPKGKVTSWRPTTDGIDRPTNTTGLSGGYYLLAYNPYNYATACGPCNSVLKSDRFPIWGAYELTGEDPVLLARERPLLIFPLGEFDLDPEEAMEFNGVSPTARTTEPVGRQRALATIEFFELDDVEHRKNLVVERARTIITLYPFLENIRNGITEAQSRRVVEAWTAASAPHTNCARSYRRLHSRNSDSSHDFSSRLDRQNLSRWSLS